MPICEETDLVQFCRILKIARYIQNHLLFSIHPSSLFVRKLETPSFGNRIDPYLAMP